MDLDQCACSGKTLGRMLRPAILGFLAREETHGYVLVQRLGQLDVFGGTPPDASGVYRTLKAMEKEGLTESSWDLGDSGPAKRRFALTQDGLACLMRWTATLEIYREQLDQLLGVLQREGAAAAGEFVCDCCA